MKILIRNNDNVVIYADDSIVLTDKAQSNSWVDYNFNSTNATIVEAELPSLWSGGVYSYTNGVWAVVNQGRYNELLQEKKQQKIQELRQVIASNTKPRVDSTLGYFVDGGRDNKDDFFSKWEAMSDVSTTTVRDADNQFHPNTTKAQMQTIYRAIVANGELLLQWKWAKEQEIEACTTTEQLNAVTL